MSEEEKEYLRRQKEIEMQKFDEKTIDFLAYIFSYYGVHEAIVKGTEQYNIFSDEKSFKHINDYIN